VNLAQPQWWRSRGHAERFDLYSRASVYVTFVLVLLLAIVGIEPQLSSLALWTVSSYLVAQTVACVLLLRAGMDHVLKQQPRPIRLIAIAGGLTVAGVAVAAVAYPHAAPGQPDGPALAILIIVVSMYVSALSVSVSSIVSGAAVLIAGMANLAVSTLEGAPLSTAVPAAIGFSALLVGVIIACRVSVWTMGLVWQLDRSRQMQARLAVAEERLRFARDLHDVVGRNLSVVALKSELAAQLLQRGRPGAVEEILAVHQIAEDSLAEVRAVVRGYRKADLVAELAGARSVLASAGVRCRVIGAGVGEGLPVDMQSTLGWVVREATTNVLRHSEASLCTVSLRRSRTDGDGTDHNGRMMLTIENDGARCAAPIQPAGSGPAGRGPAGIGPAGSGLAGVAERLALHGGSMVAEYQAPDGFRLTAMLPLPAGVEEAVA
jgi:two-component system sensor histidine kinase DesK